MSINFIAIDGDDIGDTLASLIISNDLDKIKNYSETVSVFFQTLANKFAQHGASIVFCGGDSILAYSQSDDILALLALVQPHDFSLSVGIGISSEMAYLALQLAKARGKSQVVVLDAVEGKTIKTW